MDNSEIITQHYKKIGSKGGKSWWYGLTKEQREERVKKMVQNRHKKAEEPSASSEVPL